MKSLRELVVMAEELAVEEPCESVAIMKRLLRRKTLSAEERKGIERALDEVNRGSTERGEILLDEVIYCMDKDNVPARSRPGDGPDNEDRASWAQAALDAFQEVTGTDDEDALADLLCDLMHWADWKKQDFKAAMSRGEGHYRVELKEDAR